MINTPNKIIVHHTAAVEPTPQFDAINEWHKAREFPLSRLGWYVGYHIVIEKDGTPVIARELSEEGAHTVGENFSSIGICLVGNFDVEMPTPEQVETLAIYLHAYCIAYNIKENQIFPHRKYANKDCYGTNLPDIWAQSILVQWRIKHK